MSIDFQKVKQQVAAFGENASHRMRQHENLLAEVSAILSRQANNLASVREIVEGAARTNANLIAALPTDEALNGAFHLPELPNRATLVAADGSQIFPDRHGQVFYGLVNIGAIIFAHGGSEAPEQAIRSKLLFMDETFTESGRITDRLVSLMRDLGERELLAELASGLQSPVITLTDGPLELWDAREGGMSRKTFDDHFERYLAALEKLHLDSASTAGFIDKPGSDQLVRMLEIVHLPENERRQAGQIRPFLGIIDIDLLENVLGPHERSAIFESQSTTSRKYSASLAIHFFYINLSVSEGDRPYLVRIEIPSWVAQDPAMVNDLHALLIHQSRMLGNRPYPYVLHRSHEVALVSMEEKEQVDEMIAVELRRRGVPVPPRSYKSFHKRVRGR